MPSASVGAKAAAGSSSNCCRKDVERRARIGLDDEPIKSESGPTHVDDGGDVASMIAGADDGDIDDADGLGGSGQDGAVLTGVVFMVYAIRS